MPMQAYSNYRMSFSPSYRPTSTYVPSSRTMSLLEAMTEVCQGKMSPSEVYLQCPAAVQEIMNSACLGAFGGKFESLSVDQQRGVFSGLLLALEIAGKPGISGSQPKQLKKWWQFWR